MTAMSGIYVRPTASTDFAAIAALCKRVYPESPPWTAQLLGSHLETFAEGQLVAVEEGSEQVVGMAASLIVRWDDYEMDQSWREFTANGTFANHDPNGRTLYGAEVMVDPLVQRRGVGTKLYAARRELAERLGLLRIRAGARLRGYGAVAHEMSPREYVEKVIAGELRGPTLSFQLQHGFEVIAVVSGYLRHDPESQGFAAVIEWLNHSVATPTEVAEHATRRIGKGTAR